MGFLILSEYDRKRYGAPERIEFEPGQHGMRAVRALEKETGYTLKYLNHQLAGVPETDEHGNVVTEPVLDEDGNQVVEDGVPKIQEKLTRDDEALVALIWLILWGAGIKAPWDSFDIHPLGLRLEVDDEGKAQEQGPEQRETDTSSTETT